MSKAETPQLAFEISAGKLVLPQHIFDIHPDGAEISKVTTVRKLWREKNNGVGIKGLMLIVNKEAQAYLINPTSFQVENTPFDEIFENPQFNSVIIVEDGEKSSLEKILPKVNKMLIFKSPVLIFSRKDREAEVGLLEKSRLLKDIGLVEVKTLVNVSPNYYLSEGRKEKKRPRPKEIDYLSKNEEGKYKYPWAISRFSSLINNYEKLGFKVIDPYTSEIYLSMRANTNYPRMISNLNSGFGVTLEAQCGCLWKFDLNGTRLKTKQCTDESVCLGVPEFGSFLSVKNLVEEINKYNKTDLHCYDCDVAFERHYTIDKQSGQKSVRVNVEIKCPHCGLVGEQKRDLTYEELFNEWVSLKESVLSKP